MTKTPGSSSAAGSSGEVFRDDALATNRDGRLTGAQQRHLRGQAHGFRRSELGFACVLIAIGALVAFAAGPSKDATLKPIVGAGCGIIAVLLIARSFMGADALSRDVRAGRVETIEGASFKRVFNGVNSGDSSAPPDYLVFVANHTDGEQRFKASKAAYDFAPDAGYVQLFYLPRTRRVVNLIRLPDLPLGQLGYDSMRDVVRELSQARSAKDPVRSTEARAQVAAIGRHIRAQARRVDTAPQPTGNPREQSASLVGTWRNMFGTVTFSADGSVTARLGPRGDQRGTWSVDVDGRLHTNALG